MRVEIGGANRCFAVSLYATHLPVTDLGCASCVVALYSRNTAHGYCIPCTGESKVNASRLSTNVQDAELESKKQVKEDETIAAYVHSSTETTTLHGDGRRQASNSIPHSDKSSLWVEGVLCLHHEMVPKTCRNRNYGFY
jgi:hypothetical protein